MKKSIFAIVVTVLAMIFVGCVNNADNFEKAVINNLANRSNLEVTASEAVKEIVSINAGTTKEIKITGNLSTTDITNLKNAISSCAGYVSLDFSNATFPSNQVPYLAFFHGSQSSQSQLVGVTLPDTITEIGYGAFAYTSLKSVTIPEGVTKIDNWAFARTNITSIIIPDAVTVIGEYGFLYCYSLQSAVIGKNVSLLGYRCFRDCTSLTDVSFGGTVAQWNSVVKNSYYNYNVPATTITCSDGTATF